MNPEFERNLWLEAGPRRLAWAAVALAAVYGASLLLANGQPLRTLGAAGTMVFVVSGLIWGPRVAGRAVAEEVVQRTWDFQRLSALTPWAMTWGKLFGAASLSWIAALTGLILACVASLAKSGAGASLQLVVEGLGAAVLLQAGSMALALVGVRRARAEGRAGAFRFTWGGLVGLLVVASIVGKVAPTRGLGAGFNGFDFDGAGLSWWGAQLPLGWFVALSLAAFGAWAMIGAWRLMRLELQMQNFPWAWPLFVLFAGVWAAGLTPGGGAAGRFAAAGMVFAACAYAAAFAEPADRVRLRGCAQALAARDWLTCAYAAPAVIAPIKLAVLAVIGVLASPEAGAERGLGGLVAVSALAFMVRDLGLVAYFRFGPRPGRGDFGAVVALFLAYFVGGVAGRSLGGATGMALFAPSLTAPAMAAASGGVQAVLIWVLAWSRIRAGERV